jgi:hypothetical protein
MRVFGQDTPFYPQLRGLAAAGRGGPGRPRRDAGGRARRGREHPPLPPVCPPGCWGRAGSYGVTAGLTCVVLQRSNPADSDGGSAPGHDIGGSRAGPDGGHRLSYRRAHELSGHIAQQRHQSTATWPAWKRPGPGAPSACSSPSRPSRSRSLSTATWASRPIWPCP